MGHSRSIRLVLLGALGALAASAVLVASPSRAAEPVIVANPAFASSAAGWAPTSNATLKRVVTSDGPSGQVTPKSSSGTKTIGMVSTPSDTIATLGTTVHVAGQVRSSQAGKPIVFQLRELASNGTVIQDFEGNTTPSSTSWNWTGATITTTRANSKVNLFVSEVGVTSDNILKVRTINSDVTPPSGAPPPVSVSLALSVTVAVTVAVAVTHDDDTPAVRHVC